MTIPSDREDAIIDTILVVGGAVLGLCVLVIVVACIAGPLTGHWEPDLAVGILGVMGGIGYLVYCWCLKVRGHEL